jgi:uncharacterized protein (UPF0248 family)
MNMDISFKGKFPRDILNEIRWKHYDLCKCKIYYINRGSPGDMTNVEGDKIIEISRGFLTLKNIPYEKYIPYHRIIKIEYEGKIAFIRPGYVL